MFENYFDFIDNEFTPCRLLGVLCYRVVLPTPSLTVGECKGLSLYHGDFLSWGFLLLSTSVLRSCSSCVAIHRLSSLTFTKDCFSYFLITCRGIPFTIYRWEFQFRLSVFCSILNDMFRLR